MPLQLRNPPSLGECLWYDRALHQTAIDACDDMRSASSVHGPLLPLGRPVDRFSSLSPTARACANAVDGQWQPAASSRTIPDPMTGEPFISYPDTSAEEGAPFVASLRRVPKTGLHNPLKHPERYNMYGAVSAAVAGEMRKPEARATVKPCIAT